MVRSVLSIVLFVPLLLGLLLLVDRLLRPDISLRCVAAIRAHGVDHLGIERVCDIEDCLFMDIGQDTVVLVWWVCFPESCLSAQHPHISHLNVHILLSVEQAAKVCPDGSNLQAVISP
jgi:hypothetical protein